MNQDDFDRLKSKYINDMMKLSNKQNIEDNKEDKENDNINKNTDSYKKFLKDNPENGVLKVQVFTAKQAIPVKDAKVDVSRNFNGEKKIFYSDYTDQNGIIDNMVFPAPSRYISEYPSDILPYAEYDVSVVHPDYKSIDEIKVEIFDGVKTIKTIGLTPSEKE